MARHALVAPAKAVRLLGALSDAVEELHRVNLDDAARRHLISAHRAALIEVASTVSDPLIEELAVLGARPLGPNASVDEIKVAQAQLLGWVNGLMLATSMCGTPVEIGEPRTRDDSRGNGVTPSVPMC